MTGFNDEREVFETLVAFGVHLQDLLDIADDNETIYNMIATVESGVTPLEELFTEILALISDQAMRLYRIGNGLLDEPVPAPVDLSHIELMTQEGEQNEL